MTEPIELPADEPPKSGEFIDQEEFFKDASTSELEEGQRLGETIDTDDDEDNGL